MTDPVLFPYIKRYHTRATTHVGFIRDCPDCTWAAETPLGMPLRTCSECGRVFDLSDSDDTVEWLFGHDCEVT